MKLCSFPRRAWILIRPALQTAVSLPHILSGRHIRCTGTSDSGAGTEPVMAKWCQKWPHLCQFEIKDQFVVWTLRCKCASLSPPSAYSTVAPSVRSSPCKWNVSPLIWGFMWRLTVRHTAHICGAAGYAPRCLFGLLSHSRVSLLVLGFCVIQCYFASLLFSPN